ncbi:MAG: tetratricopeptide repeat protein [Bryobacteraceae bacterium]|nr:tetratricopeptide repeat protein [Bryobacteraceae bacterium]
MRKSCGAVCLVLFLVLSCASDPEAKKRKLLATGISYLERGKPKEASLLFRRAIQTDRRFGEAYYQLGIAESSVGRYAEALAAFQRAVELLPDHSDAFDRLADLYLAAFQSDPERYSRFLTDVETLTDRAESYGVQPLAIARIRGFLALARRDAKAGIEQLRKAYALDPADRRVTLGLAGALSEAGNAAEAERIALAALEKDKSFPAIYDFLYVHYQRQGKKEQAAATILRKCENDPRNIANWFQLVAHYHRAGERVKRDELLKKLSDNPADFPDGRLAAGDFCLRIGDLEGAIRHYEAGVKSEGGNQTAYQVRLANVLSFQGKVPEALAQAEEALERSPKDDQARHLRASLEVTRGDPDSVPKAVADLEGLAKKTPDNPALRFNLGRAYAASGDLERAAAEFRKAAAVRDYLPPRYELGRLAIAKQQYAEARKLADEILAVAPQSVVGALLRATALAGLNETKEARRVAEAVVAAQPGNREALYLLARLNYQQKNFAEAERIFNRLGDMAPADLRSAHELVEVYLAQGRPDMAQAMLDRRIDRAPGSTELLLARADVALRSAQFDAAIKAYNGLLTGNRGDVRVRERLGTAYYKAGKTAAAEEQYRKAAELDPKDVAANLRLAVLLGELDRPAEARTALEQVLKLDPDNVVALNNLAYMLVDSPSELDRALSLAQRAYRKAPDNATIADTLGWVYLKKKFTDGAVKIYEDLAAKEPNRAKWRYHLGMAFAQRGDKAKARLQLQKALASGPTKDEEAGIRELLAQTES